MYVSIPDCFMIAFFAGLVFGLVYEALRIVRLILRFKAAVFLCDVLFFVLAALGVMTLSKSLGNYVRIYTVLGFGAGVFTYIVTVGRLLNLAESAASSAWRKTIGKLLSKIGRFAKTSFGTIRQKSLSAFSKISKDLKKRTENHDRHLKSSDQKLYNKERLKKLGEGEHVHAVKAKITRSS
ncbi:MAG: hypothetical protein K2N56_09680 [Oscillospiraceae bacterium]|nr:hypothetical protein [Oscillospiraceae bacterium]